MGNIVPLLSASWRPLGAGKGWILKATSTLRKFALPKSCGLSELENNSTSTFGQKIFLALLLMVTYVKYLTFAHGMLSLLNQCSTPFLTTILHFPGYYVTAAQALVHVSHQRIQTKVLLPFAHTELQFTFPPSPDILTHVYPGICFWPTFLMLHDS